MNKIEFVPPVGWKTIFIRRLGRTWAAGVFFVWRHWGFGVEFFPVGGLGVMFGPVIFATTRVREV